MFKRKLQILNLCLSMALLVAIFGCASSSPSPAPTQPDRSREAAAAAFSEMDGQMGTGGQTTIVSPPVTPTSPEREQINQSIATLERPMWIESPEMVYNRSQFITGVGHGATREAAESNALANLTAFFGQSVTADQNVSNTYFEAVRNGSITDWTDDFSIQNTVRTRASMDALIGAEIREVWHDTRGSMFYAIAVMDRARTSQIYRDLILANQVVIENLINMETAEKNSMSGYSRYQFAAVVSDMNISYSNLLNLIGTPFTGELINGNTYRLEAQNIASVLPIGVRVTNDKAGRVQGAFAKAFSDLGFRSGGANSQYICEVNITISPVELAGNTNKFVRIELSANLTDTSDGTVLLPWNFNERHGHLNESEAENRAFSGAERKINDEYKDYLSTYLARLIPTK